MSRPMQQPESAEINDLYQLCSQFHCLPRPGALFDQDAVVVALFRIILSLENERAAVAQRRSS
jgi:hypothetical protein